MSHNLSEFDVFPAEVEQNEPAPMCVVRVATSKWDDARGDLHFEKKISILKRKCTGFNILREDISQIGADGVLDRIENIDECQDGLYQVITCNETRDWEGGYIDDYDYRLIPYKE